MTATNTKLHVSVKDLSYSYKSVNALHKINIEIDKPGVHCIVGTNGSGKSTLLQLLYGLLQPADGKILLRNKFGSIMASNDIAYIPDEDNLIQELNAEEYLWFISDCYKLPKFVSDSRIQELLYIFKLSEYKKRLIRGYSHGMRKRLQLAAGLLPVTSLLVIDEPTNGLDPLGIDLTQKIIQAAGKKQIVIIATHDLALAETIADQIYILKRRVVTKGSLEAILLKTKTSNLHEAYVSLNRNNNENKFLFNYINGLNS